MKTRSIIIILLFAFKLNAQNIGINTPTPTNSLSVKGSFDVSDSIGIGIAKPNAPLQFKNELMNRKLVLFDENAVTPNQHEFYGLGVNTSALRYQSAGSHIFYSSIDGNSSKEVFKISSTGTINIMENLGIGTPNIPAEKLYVNGNIKIDGNIVASNNVLFNQRLNVFDKMAIGTYSIPNEKFYVNGNVKIDGNIEANGNVLFNQRLNILDKIAIGTNSIPGEKFYVNGLGKIDGNFAVTGTSDLANTKVNGTLIVTSNSTVNNLSVNGQATIGTSSLFSDYSIPAGQTIGVSLSCPVNTQLLTGGGGNNVWNGGTDEVTLNYNGPDPSNPLRVWMIHARNTGAVSRPLRIYCLCARIN